MPRARGVPIQTSGFSHGLPAVRGGSAHGATLPSILPRDHLLAERLKRTLFRISGRAAGLVVRRGSADIEDVTVGAYTLELGAAALHASGEILGYLSRFLMCPLLRPPAGLTGLGTAPSYGVSPLI